MDRFSTPYGAAAAQRSLLSERRDELWKGNVEELSPDSKELFDDLEEAQGGLEAKGRPGFGLFETPGSRMQDPSPMGMPRMARFDTPESAVLKSREAAGTMHSVEEARATRLSFGSLMTAPSTSKGRAKHSFLDRTDEEHDDEADEEDRVLVSREVTHVQYFQRRSNQVEEEESAHVHMEDDNEEDEDIVEDGANLTVEDTQEDESERLARQLMAEEESMLLERMQQEQINALVAMQREHGQTDNSDEALAMRLLREEEEQVVAARERAEQDGMEAHGDDLDDMSYEELLELSERIGDVKQERWRIDGKLYVQALKESEFQGPNSSGGAATCVVCQSEFEVGDKLKVLPCDHCFHSECIDPWLADHDTCVMCKQSIKELMVEKQISLRRQSRSPRQ